MFAYSNGQGMGMCPCTGSDLLMYYNNRVHSFSGLTSTKNQVLCALYKPSIGCAVQAVPDIYQDFEHLMAQAAALSADAAAAPVASGVAASAWTSEQVAAEVQSALLVVLGRSLLSDEPLMSGEHKSPTITTLLPHALLLQHHFPSGMWTKDNCLLSNDASTMIRLVQAKCLHSCSVDQAALQ